MNSKVLMNIRLFASKGSRFFSRVFFWLAIVCVAFLAGFAGGIVTQNAYVDYRIETDASQPTIFQDTARGESLQGATLDTIISQISARMLAIYDDASDAPPTLESFVGYALAVTSDGWLVTSAPMKKPLNAYRFVLKTGVQYLVNSAIRDDFSGLTFVKIAATDLRPIQFSKNTGQAFFEEETLLTDWNSAELVIAGPEWYRTPRKAAEYTHLSNTLDKRIVPERSFSVYCLPLVTSSLDVRGCTDRRGIISFANIESTLRTILRTGAIQRTSVSIQYRDLSQLPIMRTEGTSPQFGVSVKTPSPAAALVLSTPDSQSVPLFDGDMITHVNDEALDAGLNLSQAFAPFQKGDTVSLRIFSKNVFRDIRIKL